MSEEKKIEKLRGVLWLNPYVRLGSHNANMLAQYLTNEGYRKQSEVIDDFVKHLLDAFPEANRDARCPAIYYDDYREIIEEMAERMKGGDQDADISRETEIRAPGGGE